MDIVIYHEAATGDSARSSEMSGTGAVGVVMEVRSLDVASRQNNRASALVP